MLDLYLLMEGSLVIKRDLQALYLSETYCHKTCTRTLAVLSLDNQLNVSPDSKLEIFIFI